MQNKVILKNDKALKTKKFHMKSILCEVKNKNLIDQIQNQMQLSCFGIINAKSKLKNKGELNLCKKDSFIALKRIKQTNQDANKSQNFILEQRDQNVSRQSLHKNINDHKLQRRSSKIQLQLDQIIKYSKLYPSRKSSEKQIEGNINKLVDAHIINTHQKYAKSKFSMPHQQQIQQNINQETEIQKQKQQIINSQAKKNIILNLIQNYTQNDIENDAQQKKKIKFLIKKSQNLCSKYKEQFDFSLESFIENQLCTARIKKGRKTVGYLSKQKNKLDLREEVAQNMHAFMRGQYREDVEFSNYLNSKQIESFRLKYNLYNSIYKKTKQTINSQKTSVNQMKVLTFKNAVYLNQVKHQSNGKYKKNEIDKTMSALQFTY